MALAKESKSEIITRYKTHQTDTGSPEVQIALLTQRINELTTHFKTHVKDNHSRRGLLKMVSQRRSLLDYLKRRDINRYHDVINRLGIRRWLCSDVPADVGLVLWPNVTARLPGLSRTSGNVG